MITLLVILCVACCWGAFVFGLEIGRIAERRDEAERMKLDDNHGYEAASLDFNTIKNMEDSE
jgi:hypothetical protein